MDTVDTFYREIVAALEAGTLVLPTLPDVALRMNEVAADPEATIADMADIVATDAVLSTQLLKTANSPLYRGRFPVETVPAALSRLGLKMIKNLVNSLVLEQLFVAKSDLVAERLENLWQHNVEVAATCRVLSSRVPGMSAEEVMLAGLIHDIGVLPILIKAESEPELLRDSALLNTVIDQLNTRIGVAILQKWAFSERFIAVVAEHENLERDSANGPDMVDIVQVANLQSHCAHHRVRSAEELAAVPAFRKLDVQTDVQVVKLDENSEEYAEALALFSAR